MSRVIFINRYFYPDLSATSQILSDLAFHLAASGIEVMVVTGRQRYTDARAGLPAQETVAGVDISRVAATAFGRQNLPGRAVDYVTFYVSSLSKLLWRLEKTDIIIAKTDPPLISVVAALAARAKGARQINWLQDLFPEVAVVLAPGFATRVLARLTRRIRDWSLRSAEANIVLGELMRRKVEALGIAPHRVRIIPNWADDQAIRPVPHVSNPLRNEWGLDGKFVIGYSGNLGRAHEFVTILKAAQLLRDRPDVVFLVIGAGAQLRYVRDLAQRYGLTNLRELPYQPRSSLALSLSAPDLHLVSLLPELEGLIVPSKFYGIAAAGRATAFIGDVNGEIGGLLQRYDCGRSFCVGDHQGLADFLLRMASDPAECRRMGVNARAALEAEWSQRKGFVRWRNVLDDEANRTGSKANS